MTTNSLTAYAVIRRLNGVLADLEIDKALPTQMGYTYAKKGMINGTKDAKSFTVEEADAWIQKYLTKNGLVQEASVIAVPDTDGTVGEW